MFLSGEVEAILATSIGAFMLVIVCLIALLGIVAGIFEIVLAIKYIKYNRTKNSANITGVDAARRILDHNDLQDIKIKVTGSLVYGNSYSHYFKKIRLRRLTKNKTSISSLAMGAQKSCLAILDKEGDEDMKHRIKMTPIIYLGPIAFIPLIIIGALIDAFVLQTESGVATVICTLVGLIFYVVAFIFSILVLKTEKKAQERTYKVLKQERLANDEEIDMMKKLFKLYNVQYVIDVIISMLEILLRVLEIILKSKGNSSSVKK